MQTSLLIYEIFLMLKIKYIGLKGRIIFEIGRIVIGVMSLLAGIILNLFSFFYLANNNSKKIYWTPFLQPHILTASAF